MKTPIEAARVALALCLALGLLAPDAVARTPEPRAASPAPQRDRGAYPVPPHPIYARLKPYRSYYSVGKTTPLAHRFTVWFGDVAPNRCEVAANSVEEIEAWQEDDLRCAWGGIALPPPSTEPIPADLVPLAEAFEAKVAELRPGMHDFQIQYTARLRTLRFKELMSYSTDADPTERLARSAEITLAAPEGSSDFRYLGMAGFGGMGVFVPLFDEAAALPHFVEFVTPPALEGSSLAYGWATGLGGAHAEAWQALAAKLVETADALEDGSYVNPIEAVLEAQGDATLPPGVSPWLTYGFSIYARGQGDQPQVGAGFEYRFDLRRALAGPVTEKRRADEIGCEVDLTLDLAARSLRVAGRTDNGDAFEARYSIEGDWIVSGEDRAVEGGGLSVQDGGDGFDFTLPGDEVFREYDFYVGHSLYTARVFVPEVPPWRDDRRLRLGSVEAPVPGD